MDRTRSNRDWCDVTIITALLVFNAVLGFWEEHVASNALDALKNSLALKARVLRDGKWADVEAKTLVLGDVIRLYLGGVAPADCMPPRKNNGVHPCPIF